jgi:hypothetical protein
MIRLVIWNRELARERARLLEDAGFEVDSSPLVPSSIIGQFKAAPPEAIVIDLDRLPSHGRAIGVLLRRSPSTRHTPLVFAGGAPEKIDRVRADLPDAAFTVWNRAPQALRKAMRSAPVEPFRPPAPQIRSTATLARKLGFQPGMRCALLAPPDGFVEKLRDVPEDVVFTTSVGRSTQMALWFVRSRAELESETDFLMARLPQGASLWIVYPKQSGRLRVDFTQYDVREAGRHAGVVDYRICAVDDDWTGLKFARKKSK